MDKRIGRDRIAMLSFDLNPRDELRLVRRLVD